VGGYRIKDAMGLDLEISLVLTIISSCLGGGGGPALGLLVNLAPFAFFALEVDKTLAR